VDIFFSLSLSAAESSTLWSFVIIADPHIQGAPQHSLRLKNAVDWINQNKYGKRIQLVFVLGDIAWGDYGERLREAKGILDRLTVPYIPLIGDNEYNFNPNGEWLFAEVFAPQYNLLSHSLQNWQKIPVFESLSIDEKDNIWIQRYAPKWVGTPNEVTTYDVFSSEGVFQQAIKIAGHIITPLKFKNGFIYALRMGESGFIKAVRLSY
jgi:hypothetical protein